MITKKDVQHIAKLARIELTPEEEERFEKDLSGVLDFVGQLNKVNTENTEALAGGTNLKNVMRSDEPDKSLMIDDQLRRSPEARSESRPQWASGEPEEVAEIIKAAPEHKDGYVKVKAVFN